MDRIKDLYAIYQKRGLVSTDSRRIEKGSIFFALKGENFNGNRYAKQALLAGASLAVIDEKKNYIDEQTILVDNVLSTLQKLAAFHRAQFKFPVIGITGTNGKTTTKELIFSVLSKKLKAFATQGNLNNHIGVPLTLLATPTDADIAIIEMGANHIGEIEFLCDIAKPNYGIITNIGKAHIEGFGSIDGVKKAKGELYKYIRKTNGMIFINSDDSTLKEISSGLKRIQYGKEATESTHGKIVSNEGHIEIECSIENQPIHISTNLTGSYNLPNILAACCIGNHFSVSSEQIKDAIENYIPSNNRSQLKETKKNNILILDAYNANPESMKVSIDNFFSMNPKKGKFAIIGDMLELGHISTEEHTKIVHLFNSNGFKDVIFVGKEFLKISKEEDIMAFEQVEAAIQHLKERSIENSLILLKGSRGIRLEKTIDYL